MGLWQSKYAQAERIFLALAQQNPAKIGPHLGLAQSRIHQGQFDDAETELNKAAAIDPDDEHVRVWQGMLLLLRSEAEAGKALLGTLAKEAKAEDVRALSQQLLGV